MKTNKYKTLKKILKKPGNQTPCHSRFPAGSFAVRFGDHIRSGIICGRRSCGAVQTSFPVRHWNLKNLTTDISLDHSRLFPPAQYFRMALLLLSQIKGHLYFLFVQYSSFKQVPHF